MRIANLQHGVVVKIPKEAETWYTMAYELMHQQRYEAAIQNFDKALDIDPEYSLA